ncbi:MAG: hypothetical protein IJ888_02450 [Prevotella sp.]|nr:hypothetical protein [Prevotella sp.]
MINENFDLENMRLQMETLKKKLDQQEIVNDRIIRHSMKKTANTISRRYYFIMAVCLLMIPYSYWAFVMLNGFSIPFWMFTCFVMLVCCGGTYYNNRNLSDSNMMTNNLVDVRRRMARAKKFDANWLLIGIPLAIVFLGWFMYESYQLHPDAFFNGLFWAGCIGGVIGAIWGFSLHFKTQHQYQEIIDQIEDITQEN